MTTFSPAATVYDLIQQDTPRSYGVIMSADDPWACKLSAQIALVDLSGETYGTWVDITQYVRGLHWERGSTVPLTQPEVGTAELTVDNTGGDFSTWNLDSALFPGNPFSEDPSGDTSTLRPNTPIRFGITKVNPDTSEESYEPFFTGLLESVEEDSEQDVDGWCVLSAVDMASALAQYGAGLTLAQTSGAYGATFVDLLQLLLDDISWPYGVILAEDLDGDPFADGFAMLPPDNQYNRLQAAQDLATAANCIVYATSGGPLIAIRANNANELESWTATNAPSDSNDYPVAREAITPYSSVDRILNTVTGQSQLPTGAVQLELATGDQAVGTSGGSTTVNASGDVLNTAGTNITNTATAGSFDVAAGSNVTLDAGNTSPGEAIRIRSTSGGQGDINITVANSVGSITASANGGNVELHCSAAGGDIELFNSGSGYIRVSGATGHLVLQGVAFEPGDYALLASPGFSGNPTAPTQSAGNNSTRLATTAYVDSALSTFTLPALSNGKLWIGNGSNVATAVTLTGDVTVTNAGVTAIGSGKITTTMIAANAVTLAKLATQADQTILGNNSGGSAVPSALTVAQVLAMLYPAYTTYSPVVSQSTVPTQTVGEGRYVQAGKNIKGYATVNIGTPTAGTAANAVAISLPVAPLSTGALLGDMFIYDSSANLIYTGKLVFLTGTSAVAYADQAGVSARLGTAHFTAALANGDVVQIVFDYETA